MVISWILVIIWASVIFFMSSMDTNKSNKESKSAINQVIQKTVDTSSELGIIDKVQVPTEKKKKETVEELNQPLRKVAHASEYCVFTILLTIALSNSGLKGKKIFIIALAICFIYACSDEYHQTFVKGRTGQFSDSLIDTLGGAIGVTLIFIKYRIKSKKIIQN